MEGLEKRQKILELYSQNRHLSISLLNCTTNEITAKCNKLQYGTLVLFGLFMSVEKSLFTSLSPKQCFRITLSHVCNSSINCKTAIIFSAGNVLNLIMLVKCYFCSSSGSSQWFPLMLLCSLYFWFLAPLRVFSHLPQILGSTPRILGLFGRHNYSIITVNSCVKSSKRQNVQYRPGSNVV